LKAFILISGIFLIASCGGSRELLEVRTYTLKEENFDEDGELLIRGEAQRLLYGAVTLEQRRERIGEYFTVRVREGASSAQPARIRFEYRQSSSGSQIKQANKSLNTTDKGVVEFAIKGKSYQSGGSVTSWRVSSYDGKGNLLDQKRSYLWE